MPYINKNKRLSYDFGLNALEKQEIENAGDLNYLITKLALIYLKKHKLSYNVVNDIMGAINGSLMEFYRRIIGGMEDNKIQENGDVYNNLDFYK